MTGRAIEPGHAGVARVQARRANGPRRLHDGVESVVALGDAASTLEQKRTLAGHAKVFGRACTRLARRVAWLAMPVLVKLGRVASAPALRRAKIFFIQSPALDAAGAARGSAARAPRRTGHAFAPLFVRAVAHWTRARAARWGFGKNVFILKFGKDLRPDSDPCGIVLPEIENYNSFAMENVIC